MGGHRSYAFDYRPGAQRTRRDIGAVEAGDGTTAEAPGGPSGACRAGDAEVEIRSGRSCGSQRVATILRPAWGHRFSQAPVCLWNSFPDNWLPAAGKREDAGKRCASRLQQTVFLYMRKRLGFFPCCWGAGNLSGYQKKQRVRIDDAQSEDPRRPMCGFPWRVEFYLPAYTSQRTGKFLMNPN